MKRTAHHAIKVRLTMWKTFLETGVDSTPAGATNAEYGLDQLINLAYDTDNTALHDLADVVDLMGQNYILRMNHEQWGALMSDGDEWDTTPPTHRISPAGITMEELDRALAGH
ncbi:MAG: hypothetical protein Q7T10_10245 [Rhodoferax sp.]|uniref:hypothetical protein n=1 Tax=Rhodoferax sp. TaxID=50421 RepID=UPI002719B847|nr:hypothetical protein [Rhodoferax sp.]MDO8449170.1 hypothetical protein [Rhodoferax sp.]